MHGGSIRIYAQDVTMKKEETESLIKLKEKEFRLGANKLQYFTEFEAKMAETRVQLRKIILDISESRKSIVGYGAPARATTLSAYIGIEFIKEHLEAVIDDAPAKQGAFMPGTHLKIVSSEILKGKKPPDYIFLFAWPWVNDVVEKNMNYLRGGGRIIIPLPQVRVLDITNVSDIIA